MSPTQELFNNLPFAIMVVLGAAVLWMSLPAGPWRCLAVTAYALYGPFGSFWIIWFLCPYCQYHGTRFCPCGYGRISGRLRPRRGSEQFNKLFHRHMPIVIPLWLVPPAAGIIALIHGLAWPLLIVLLVFVLNSYVILPWASRKYGCNRCPQKDICPWMGHWKQGQSC